MYGCRQIGHSPSTIRPEHTTHTAQCPQGEKIVWRGASSHTTHVTGPSLSSCGPRRATGSLSSRGADALAARRMSSACAGSGASTAAFFAAMLCGERSGCDSVGGAVATGTC